MYIMLDSGGPNLHGMDYGSGHAGRRTEPCTFLLKGPYLVSPQGTALSPHQPRLAFPDLSFG